MLDTAHTPKSFSLLHSGLTGDKFNTSYAREVAVTGEADLIEAWTWVNGSCPEKWCKQAFQSFKRSAVISYNIVAKTNSERK